MLEKPLHKGRSKEQNEGIKKSEPDCKKVKIQFYPPEENDALVIGFSRGKGVGEEPRAICGGIRDFVATLQQIQMTSQLAGKMWGEARGAWEQVVFSLD